MEDIGSRWPEEWGKRPRPSNRRHEKNVYASGIRPGTNSSCFPFSPCGMAFLDRKGVIVVNPAFLCESMATRRSSLAPLRIVWGVMHRTIPSQRSSHVCELLKSNRQTPLYLVFPAFAGSDPRSQVSSSSHIDFCFGEIVQVLHRLNRLRIGPIIYFPIDSKSFSVYILAQ